MDRNSFSYVWLVLSSLGSFLHLSWMLFQGKFTFSYLGMIFIILYGLQTCTTTLTKSQTDIGFKPHMLIVSEYKSTPVDVLEVYEDSDYLEIERLNSTQNRTTNNSNPRKNATATATRGGSQTYVQYRQFSPSQQHHLSSHRLQVDSRQPICITGDEDTKTKLPSVEFAILQFCVYLLSTSFLTTDLFFAYQIFAPELNYLPFVGGMLNIIPALYIGNARRTHVLFIFTIPANCWGQIYYAGFNQNNMYAMLAGYLFFVAYYYTDIQRVFKGLTPQSQANYYMGSYCVFASLALHTAFAKFNMKSLPKLK